MHFQLQLFVFVGLGNHLVTWKEWPGNFGVWQ